MSTFLRNPLASFCPRAVLGAAVGTALAALLAPASAHADGLLDERLKLNATWRQRYEVWNFFEPSGAAGTNNTYGFYGSDLRASATWTDELFSVLVEGQAVGLLDLPQNAVGTPAEGPFGTGALYRAQNGNQQHDASVFLRQAVLELKDVGVPGLRLKGGRQTFAEGKEAPASDPTLAWLQNLRIAERLIGPFDFTYVGRSFDSALLQWKDGPWNVTALYGRPTQGGFALDAMESMDDVDLGYASINLTQPDGASTTAARRV
jgi:hypothetical protein